jgi:hypothetical protein
MRYVGIRSAQSVVICVKDTFLLLREKEIDTREYIKLIKLATAKPVDRPSREKTAIDLFSR